MGRFPVVSRRMLILLLVAGTSCAPCRTAPSAGEDLRPRTGVPATGVTRETPFSRGTMKEAEEYDAGHPRSDNTLRAVPFHEMPPRILPEK